MFDKDEYIAKLKIKQSPNVYQKDGLLVKIFPLEDMNTDAIRVRKINFERIEEWDEHRRASFLNEIKSQLHNHRKVSTVSYNLS